MGAFVEFLNGKKSYIIGASIGLVVFAFAAGLIGKDTSELLITLLGGGAVLTLRAAISNGG